MGGVDAVHHQATLADGGSTSRLALKDWQVVDSSRGLRGWLVGVIGLCDTGGRRWRRWQRREVLRDLRIVGGKLAGEAHGSSVGEQDGREISIPPGMFVCRLFLALSYYLLFFHTCRLRSPKCI